MLPRLQKRIILYLAQSEPQNINETMKGISGEYKTSWNAFKALEEKGLIKHVKSGSWRGRQYRLFWLTDLGIFTALHEGAKSEVLLKTTQEIYPQNKNIQFIIEAVSILGKTALGVLHLAVSNKGVIEERPLISIMNKQKELTPKQQRQFMTMLKKYPEPYQQCADSIEEIQTKLKDLSNLL